MVQLVDTTLREGAQACGVSLALPARRTIATLAARLGVEELEVGVATPLDRDLPALMAHCRTLGREHGCRLALWCRCRPEDIDHAAVLAPDLLALSIPGSDNHLQRRLGLDRRGALALLVRSVARARARGIAQVALGVEDASRGEEDFLLALGRVAQEAGACRLRLADTVGLWSPATTARMVRRCAASLSGLAIGLHLHNDFGLATANAVSGIEAGASAIDVSFLGLGERAGIARLEEVLAWLCLRRGRRQDLRGLAAASRQVGRLTGTAVESRRPLVGEAVFSCETGIHLHGLIEDPALYEPFAPQAVGGRRRLFFGAKCGRAALQHKLSALGREPAAAELERLVPLVRRVAARLDRSLTDSEILALAYGQGTTVRRPDPTPPRQRPDLLPSPQSPHDRPRHRHLLVRLVRMQHRKRHVRRLAKR